MILRAQMVLDVPRSAFIQGFEMNVENHLVLALLSIALDGPELLLRLPLDVAVFMGKLLLQEVEGEEEGGLVGEEAGGDVGAASVVNDHSWQDPWCCQPCPSRLI